MKKITIMKRIIVAVLLAVSFVASADVELAPDGTWVKGDPKLAPDGSWVGGNPELAPDGSWQ